MVGHRFFVHGRRCCTTPRSLAGGLLSSLCFDQKSGKCGCIDKKYHIIEKGHQTRIFLRLELLACILVLHHERCLDRIHHGKPRLDLTCSATLEHGNKHASHISNAIVKMTPFSVL